MTLDPQLAPFTVATANAFLADWRSGASFVSPTSTSRDLAVNAAKTWAAAVYMAETSGDRSGVFQGPLPGDAFQRFSEWFGRFEAGAGENHLGGPSPRGMAELFALDTIAKRAGVHVKSSFLNVPGMEAKKDRFRKRTGGPVEGNPRIHLATFDNGVPYRTATLFLGGLGENGPVNYVLQAIRMARDGRGIAVVPNWFGHGESDILDLPTYAEDSGDYTKVLHALFAEMKIRYPHGNWEIMAHSMGAAALLTYFADHPDAAAWNFIGNITLVAPMLGLRGLGYFSQLLYRAGLLKWIIGHSVGPLGFPVSHLTSDTLEQARIRQRQAAGVSDFQSAAKTRWLFAANEMMQRVAGMEPPPRRGFSGKVHLFVTTDDRIVDSRVAEREVRRLFPDARIHPTQGPHRVHTDPEAWQGIQAALIG